MALLTTTKRRGRASARTSHAAAGRHLAKADPVLRTLIARVGPCQLVPHRHHFATLCDSIISQQLSTRVAEVIFDRFAGLYPQRRPTPQAVRETPLPRLRSVGLSRQKGSYLKDLATGFLDGRVRPGRLARQSNEEIIEALVSIHGIGRWTAEMFLIFSLNRPDVLPVDDLGIKKAIQRWYGLRSLPTAKKIRRIGKDWHPYETIASWYLWRSLRLD
ncbi:MAG: DNA-3-methyladenine glycosylase 2 family protein [Nitrospirae bacterium]|nr:DNA-3-methyladenine glycosylase 2 family protein [Nitrospirota bacterium]